MNKKADSLARDDFVNRQPLSPKGIASSSSMKSICWNVSSKQCRQHKSAFREYRMKVYICSENMEYGVSYLVEELFELW